MKRRSLFYAGFTVFAACAPKVETGDFPEPDGPETTVVSYISGGKYIGEGVEISGTVWAPVNCGYEDGLYPSGRLYMWGRPDSGRYSDPQTDNASWLYVIDDEYLHAKDDPCPDGWRIPNSFELSKLYKGKISGSIVVNGVEGRYFYGLEGVRKIFLPAAGYIGSSGNKVYEKGNTGAYWSCSASETEAAAMIFRDNPDSEDSITAGEIDMDKMSSCSIRCVKY